MSDFLESAARLDTRVLLIVLLAVLNVWAIGMTLASQGSRREKVLWSAIILLCPIIGCLFWFSLGPKPNLIRSASSRRGTGR